MIIRRATSKDAEIISLLARITFDDTFGHLYRDRKDLLDYFERTFSVPKLRASLLKNNNAYWLAFIDDFPVGYAKLKLRSITSYLQEEEISQLQKIYVLKDFFSQNVGRLLQDKVIEKATETGSKELWLSVLYTNDRAVRFYKKSGFREIGDHHFTIGKETFYFTAMSLKLH